LARRPRLTSSRMARRRQGARTSRIIAQALASSSVMLDVDRSELDEHGVALRVAEHLRPLTREEPWSRRTADLDQLARVAESMRHRAPFAAASRTLLPARTRATALHGVLRDGRTATTRGRAGRRGVRARAHAHEARGREAPAEHRCHLGARARSGRPGRPRDSWPAPASAELRWTLPRSTRASNGASRCGRIVRR